MQDWLIELAFCGVCSLALRLGIRTSLMIPHILAAVGAARCLLLSTGRNSFT